MGNHMGLVKRINGVKTMKLRTVAVTVRPARRSKMEPEMRRLRRPMSWVEFGAWSLSLRRNAEVVELVKVMLMEWFWWGDLGALVLWVSAEFWWGRSAMVEYLRYCERETMRVRNGEGLRKREREVLKKGRR